ncbi:MAG: dockerin type I domain-containing protein [Clostridia bacterium]|nr:dockerin type I domain-containing protein [Clostridia bacterium]
MKKLSAILLAATLACAILPGLSAAAPRQTGDVNGDGTVNIDDILLVRDHIFGAERHGSLKPISHSDCNSWRIIVV